MSKKKTWVRLKRFIQKLIRVETPPQRGDGGLYTDKFIQVTKPQIDSTLTIKDTATVARPMNQ